MQQNLSPNIDKVAHAYARKFNWYIQPSGDTALNLLGLSTQVPGRYVYLSNGPNKSYQILNTTLEFKHRSLKESGFKYDVSVIIVQALKTLGKERSELFLETAIQKNITPAIAEKDFWVTFILERIFSDKKLASMLIFKGGTSLSKVYRVH